MGLKHLHFLFLILPMVGYGQYRLAGRVTDILSHKPVENVSVFLSNTSAAAKTNEDGTFEITNAHNGHYDLVVSRVGYVTYHQEIDVNNNIDKLDLKIEAKNITLKEVRIGPDRNWDRNYRMFKEQFLGHSENAGAVKILNPQVLSLHYDQDKRELTASSYDFLVIENKALGYRIKYLLTNFTATYTGFNGVSLYYEGSPLFEDLPGRLGQLKKWKKKRQEVYLGSEMHFLRSIIANRVAEEGFTVRRLIRKPNPDYPQKSSKRYTEMLVTTPVTPNDYAKRTDQAGEYAIAFNDCLYITYNKAGEDTSPASVISFTEPYVFFDSNGVVINPRSAISEENWSNYRMPEMLPNDYEPSPL